MYLKDRKSFINENKIINLILEKSLSYSDNFLDFLQKNTNDLIIGEIIQHINKDINDIRFDYIDINPASNDEIIFIQGSKLKTQNPEAIDYYTGYNNSSMKVGRFIRNLYTTLTEKKPVDKDIEKTVNLYKAYIDSKYKKLEIIDGEKIKWCYLTDNYSNDNGTLGQSCMRFKSSQINLDIYVEENVKLLVLFDDNQKVSGRALIWNLDNGLIFLDRIYTNNDSDVNLFISYAIRHGWLYKKDQTYNNKNNIYKNNIFFQNEDLFFPTKKFYDFYPYMDTFKYLQQDGRLYMFTKSKEEITLSSESNDIVHSEYFNLYIADRDAVFSEEYGYLLRTKSANRNNQWYPRDVLQIDVNASYELKEELIYNKEFDFYINKNESIIDVNFFDRKVQFSDCNNFIVYVDEQYCWAFNTFEYKKWSSHEFKREIFGAYKEEYEKLIKILSENEGIKEGKLYKDVMSFSDSFKFGKTYWSDYKKFQNALSEFNEWFLSEYKKNGFGITNDELMRESDFYYVMHYYFIQEFNKLNYPQYTKNI